jgi:hypothetical protein
VHFHIIKHIFDYTNQMYIVYSLHTYISPTSSGVTFTIIRRTFLTNSTVILYLWFQLSYKNRNSNICTVVKVKVKVKQFHYRPGQALRVPGGWGSQIWRQSAHEGGKVVSPTHRPPLPPGKISVLISVRGWVDPRVIMRPEGLCQWKNPMIPSGLEPAIFQLVD